MHIFFFSERLRIKSYGNSVYLNFCSIKNNLLNIINWIVFLLDDNHSYQFDIYVDISFNIRNLLLHNLLVRANTIIIIEYQLPRRIMKCSKCLSFLPYATQITLFLIKGSQQILMKWRDFSQLWNPN